MTAPSAAPPRAEAGARARAAAIATALVFPNLVWIALDRGPIGGDASQYAAGAMELFAKLRAAPAEWPGAMLSVMPNKPPALEWLGQLFLPLAFPLGEAGRPLLLAVALAAIAALAWVWAAAEELAGSRAAALAGTLAVAGAPLFVTYGNAFMVEVLQVTAVAWFVAIAAFAARWPRALVLAQLAAAGAFAALTKTTTLGFVVWPALVALAAAFRGAPRPRLSLDRATRFALAAALVLGTAALLFYLRNWTSLFGHFRAGVGASAWGKVDTPLATAAYWVETVGRHALTPWALAGLAVLALFACVPRFARPEATSAHFDRCALAAAAQVATVIALFSLSSNRMPRFLAPILPLLAVVVAWAVARVGSPVARGAAIAALAAQFAVVHLSSFGVVEAFRDAVRPIDRAGDRVRLLRAIVDSTCEGGGRAPLTIIAIDPNFRGDWLAPAPATYFAAERRLLGKTASPCRYDYLGRRFFGDEGRSWESLAANDVDFVVATDPAIHPPLAKTFNVGLDSDHYPEVWARLSTSELFARAGTVAGEPGIVLFRRR